MKEVVSTIITKNYGHYALVLHDSLINQLKYIHFCVFISNGKLPQDIQAQLLSRPNVTIYYEDAIKDKLAIQLKEKFAKVYHDEYRWGMKPLLLNKLLDDGYERAIYVDSDICFYSDYAFLFESLKKYNILLSPHWRCSMPDIDTINFKLNFLDGIYNGGFIGASKGGEKALNYWAELCLFNCEVNRNEGFFVDQRYLDILPTRFEGVGHIIHKGCNVANWNQVDCKRILKPNGMVLINNKWPIVFVHFTNSTLGGILLGNDKFLYPFLEQYKDALLKYNDVNIIEEFFEKEHLKNSRREVVIEKPVATKSKFYKRFIKKLENRFKF